MFTLLIIFGSVMLLTFYIRRKFSRTYQLAQKISGPKGHPIFGHAIVFLKKEFLTAMMELDALYSGMATFWIGPKLVIGMNQPELYEVILSNKSALDKGDFYHFMRPLFGDGLIAADSAIWQVNKKVVAPMLNALTIKAHFNVFVEGSQQLIKLWRNKIGAKFEPYTDVSKTAFGFTMRTAIGNDASWPESKLEEMISLVNKISAGVAYRFVRPWLHPDFIFNVTPTGRQVNADTAAFRRFLSEMIASKEERNTDFEEKDNSFIRHILDAAATNPKFSKKSVLDELSTYMTAGFETTSTAITFTLVMLGCFPKLQQKAFEEQLELIKNDNEELNWDNLNEMNYLDMFIKETMRLFPVITVIGRQLSTDIVVGQHTVPSGAFAMVPVYAVHRNSKIWTDPNEFDPERFNKELEAERHPQSFLPFGAGSRVCMGQKYAMISMKVMLASILREYEILTDYSIEEIKLSKSVTLNTNGLHISLKAR